MAEVQEAQRSLRKWVEDLVASEIEQCELNDERLKAADYHDIFTEVSGKVLDCMANEQRTALDSDDYAFIEGRVGQMVDNARAAARASARAMSRIQTEEGAPKKQRRFDMGDRVVCCVGGEREWAPGKVQALDEEDPSDVTGQAILPYVVKIDPPLGRLISVPKDVNNVVRAEVCFGQRAGGLWFTRFCLPQCRPGAAGRGLRFGVGKRVACAVEDAADDKSVWAAGTVLGVNHYVDEWEGEGGPVPYQVKLDSGCTVLVHRDEHWLVRDLALQPAEAPRRGCVSRLVKRQRDADGAWEVIDYMTCVVRPAQAPDSDTED